MTDKSSISLLNVWWCQGWLMISYSRSRICGWIVRKGVYRANEQFDDVRNCDLVDKIEGQGLLLQASGKQSYQHRKFEMSFQNQIWNGWITIENTCHAREFLSDDWYDTLQNSNQPRAYIILNRCSYPLSLSSRYMRSNEHCRVLRCLHCHLYYFQTYIARPVR